jgi:hypothetical protein
LNHNFLRSKRFSNHFYLQQGLTKQNNHREKNRRGRIWPGLARSRPDRPSRLAGQPGWGPNRYGASAVRLGRDQRPSAIVLGGLCMRAREAQPQLGFHGKCAHRGHRGQAMAGIGRGVVEEGRCRRRSCMQRLGMARGFRRCSDVYGNGVVGFISPVRNREQVRSRCCSGVPSF